jgi:hypothetical protein
MINKFKEGFIVVLGAGFGSFASNISTKGVKIVGGCQGRFPYNTSTSGTSSYVCSENYQINFIDETNKEYDFLIITSWPEMRVDTMSEGGIGYNGIIPIESIIIGLNSQIIGMTTRDGADPYVSVNIFYNASVNKTTGTLTLQSVDKLYRDNIGNVFTCMAYKYE